MKEFVYVICLLALLVFPAYAQPPELLKANIPFGFYAGERWMPAGEYKFFERGGFVAIRSTEGAETLVVVFGGSKAGSNDRPEINFSKYSGDRIFLARLHSPMWGNSPILVKSKRERETVSSRVVSQTKPETVVILARVGR